MQTINLAGKWTLSCDRENFGTVQADVPGDNYSALLRNGLIPDPYLGKNEEDVQWVRDFNWTYTKDFQVGADLLAKDSVYLNIDSLDTFADIRINAVEFVGNYCIKTIFAAAPILGQRQHVADNFI